MVLAWENLRRFLWCCSFLMLHIFIYLHLSMFFILLVLYLYFISRLLCHVTGTPPWLLRPMKVFTSFELYPDYFWLPILFHLPRVLRFWVDIFTHRCFLPYTSSWHFSTFPTFWHNLLLSRFHWGPAATFLKVAGLHNGPRNTDPAHLFVWFTVIHNILYILSQYFIHLNVNIAKVLLVVKCLIRSAATLFSSHENIKQQLN